jgi:hypothetical protein
MTAIGGPYATRAQLKGRMGIPDSNTSRDTELDAALATGADTIHRYCGRQFGRAETATERFFVWGQSGADVDDFWTTDDLVIAGTAYDPDGNYALEPEGGIRDGVPGWPYERIAYPFAALAHPIYTAYRGTVRFAVTAKWGWEAVPANVEESNLLLAQDDLKGSDAPFGFSSFGDYTARVRANPRVAEKLEAYQRDSVKVAT